jgi:hypothetical protein
MTLEAGEFFQSTSAHSVTQGDPVVREPWFDGLEYRLYAARIGCRRVSNQSIKD